MGATTAQMQTSQVKDTSEDPVYLDPRPTSEFQELATLLIVVFVEHRCPLHDTLFAGGWLVR